MHIIPLTAGADATSPPGRGGCRRSCDCADPNPGRGQRVSQGARHGRVPTATSRFRQRMGVYILPDRNLELVFTQRFGRTVDGDNTVSFHNLVMQLERAHWRHTLAGCKAIIHQHHTDTHDRKASVTIARKEKAVNAAEQKADVERKKPKNRLPSTCKSRTLRAIRTFPPPLRLLN